jgi:hypothetical protein
MENELTAEINTTNLSFVVSPSAKSFIKNTGFKSMSEILNVQPLRIARELGMDPHKVLAIVEEIKSCNDVLNEYHEPKKLRTNGTTVLTLLDESRAIGRHIVTYSHALDNVLGGGISVGEISEFCGVPGSGKTQLAMQLAVDVCIPTQFGGLGGECLYIDTEGSFSAERVYDMVHVGLLAFYTHLLVLRNVSLGRVKPFRSGSRNENRQRLILAHAPSCSAEDFKSRCSARKD